MLTRLLVSRLLVNIAYIKIWVHLTFVPVHLRKKVRRTSAPSAKSYSRALFLISYFFYFSLFSYLLLFYIFSLFLIIYFSLYLSLLLLCFFLCFVVYFL